MRTTGEGTGLAAVVLAAGGSSRLGRPKQLIEIDGVPLVRRIVDIAANAGCAPVVVVLGRDAEACSAALAGTPAVIVHNENWPQGMGSSIRLGFRALGADIDRAVLLLCDQPHVTADTIRRLDRAHAEAGRPVCVAEYAGTVGPPVVVDRATIALLRDWPEAGGAKRLWADRPRDAVCRVPCPEAATDVDTPADVEGLGR